MLRSIWRSTSIVGGAFALIAASAGLLANTSTVTAASQHQIQISDFAFHPGNMTIEAGDIVTWNNVDDSPHTVTAEGGSFDSGNLDEGASFSFRFTGAGTYEYRCNYHSEMRATIVVEAAPAEPAEGGSTHAQTHGDAKGGGTTAGTQPNTALPAPLTFPNVSLVLWGIGLLIMGVSLLPIRRPR